MRGLAVVGMLFLAAAGGCADDSSPVRVESADAASAPLTATAEPSTGEAAVPRCGPGVAAEPCGPGLQEGQQYPYLLQTHCGVKGIYANGREWVPEAGQDVGENRAPVGFADPEDYGSLTLSSDDHLDYRSSSGVTLRFVPGEIPQEDCN